MSEKTDVVEVVARAICDSLAACRALPRQAKSADDPWVVGPALIAARAALSSIPVTEEMVEAGAAWIRGLTFESDDVAEHMHDGAARQAARAAIQAALKAAVEG